MAASVMSLGANIARLNKVSGKKKEAADTVYQTS